MIWQTMNIRPESQYFMLLVQIVRKPHQLQFMAQLAQGSSTVMVEAADDVKGTYKVWTKSARRTKRQFGFLDND